MLPPSVPTYSSVVFKFLQSYFPLLSGPMQVTLWAPVQRKGKIAQFLWEELWNHIANDVDSGRGRKLEPVLKSGDLTVCLSAWVKFREGKQFGDAISRERMRPSQTEQQMETPKLHWVAASTPLAGLFLPHSRLWSTIAVPRSWSSTL